MGIKCRIQRMSYAYVYLRFSVNELHLRSSEGVLEKEDDNLSLLYVPVWIKEAKYT